MRKKCEAALRTSSVESVKQPLVAVRIVGTLEEDMGNMETG